MEKREQRYRVKEAQGEGEIYLRSLGSEAGEMGSKIGAVSRIMTLVFLFWKQCCPISDRQGGGVLVSGADIRSNEGGFYFEKAISPPHPSVTIS